MLYCIDWDAPLAAEDDYAEAFEVPATHNPLTASDYSELCELVNPMVYSESHGINHYHQPLPSTTTIAQWSL